MDSKRQGFLDKTEYYLNSINNLLTNLQKVIAEHQVTRYPIEFQYDGIEDRIEYSPSSEITSLEETNFFEEFCNRLMPQNIMPMKRKTELKIIVSNNILSVLLKTFYSTSVYEWCEYDNIFTFELTDLKWFVTIFRVQMDSIKKAWVNH